MSALEGLESEEELAEMGQRRKGRVGMSGFILGDTRGVFFQIILVWVAAQCGESREGMQL